MCSVKEQRDYARDLWWREHELMNHRLTWLGVVQTLLFTAYGFSVVSALGFEIIISYAGILTAVIIFLGTIAAVVAQINLSPKINGQGKTFPLGIRTTTTLLGWMPPVLIPLLSFGVWVYLLACYEPPTRFFP